jgi:hypothetical protein
MRSGIKPPCGYDGQRADGQGENIFELLLIKCLAPLGFAMVLSTLANLMRINFYDLGEAT